MFYKYIKLLITHRPVHKYASCYLQSFFHSIATYITENPEKKHLKVVHKVRHAIFDKLLPLSLTTVTNL